MIWKTLAILFKNKLTCLSPHMDIGVTSQVMISLNKINIFQKNATEICLN